MLQAPPDASLVNPFRAKNVEDFNMWYFLIGIFGYIINYISWQGSQGYRCSAINAKEQKIGQALNYLRTFTQTILVVIVSICVYTVLHHPDFSHQATRLQASVSRIADATFRQQVKIWVGSSVLLKSGLFGCMCALMLAGFITTHDTYMHSWGSIFIQDVILPFRKKPFTPKQHINMLRLSILGRRHGFFVQEQKLVDSGSNQRCNILSPLLYLPTNRKWPKRPMISKYAFSKNVQRTFVSSPK